MDIITIPAEYVQRLERVQAERQKTLHRGVSLPGLVEEILTDWLYTAETELELSPRGLPVEEINGKRYYRDNRLQEYRNVANPHDRLPWSARDTEALVFAQESEANSPKKITHEEWAEIIRLSRIREAWSLDAQTTPEGFASRCYGARFDFVSGGPGYCGDLYLLYGDALSGAPFVLTRKSHDQCLQVIENDEG